ncbi:hypothetical protein NL457_28310, partial [Klebsiella pneumoniae]|nr:hypothetical protein [Klebsiella pneumoniae]
FESIEAPEDESDQINKAEYDTFVEDLGDDCYIDMEVPQFELFEHSDLDSDMESFTFIEESEKDKLNTEPLLSVDYIPELEAFVEILESDD